MFIKQIEGDKGVWTIEKHEETHKQKDALGGSPFRRCMERDTEIVDMSCFPTVFEQETHYVEAGPHQENHKQDVFNY